MRVTTEHGQTLVLSKQIGEGGEARIYAAAGNRVAKVYKDQHDPSFATGGSEEQRNRDGARKKLQEIWFKLAAFPHGLSARVIEPREIISQGTARVGYLMDAVETPHACLRDWMDRGTFQTLSSEQVRDAFRILAETVAEIHLAAVVGDFNDLNVLVPSSGPVLIDADSFQFKTFPCRTFQQRFVDPLICDPAGHSLCMVKPHTTDTDWYALRVMLYQVLRGIGPYDGVYRPKVGKLNHEARPLHRITVHRPEVIVPKFATQPDQLHPDLMHEFVQVFDHDQRGPVRLELLDLIGQRAGTLQPQAVSRAHGKVTAEEVVVKHGKLLHAQLTPDGLALISSIRGTIYRDGKPVLSWPGNHSLLRFLCHGHETVVLNGANAKVIGGRDFLVDLFDNRPVLAASPRGIIYQYGSDLLRQNLAGTESAVLGTVSGTANFWYGSSFGFGFYRVGKMYRHFVFRDDGTPLNDSVEIPRPRGQVVDEGFLGGACAWYWRREQRRKIHTSLWSINPAGERIAFVEADDGQGSWLDGVRGARAIGQQLYVPTDDGLLRIGPQLDSTEFPDASPWVDGSTTILGASRRGLAVWRSDKVFFLKMS